MGAAERDEWLRAAWRVRVAQGLDARRLVFVDECGIHTSLLSLYAWARRGERARCSVPRNRGPNTTLLASMTVEGMGPCLAIVGPTTREVFETYLERVLAPKLRAGQVVVMDNLTAHTGEKVRELIEQRGCKLLYLPPYSRRISTRSRKPSARSKRCYGEQELAPARLCWRRWVQHSMR